jgi:hypothetical protein
MHELTGINGDRSNKTTTGCGITARNPFQILSAYGAQSVSFADMARFQIVGAYGAQNVSFADMARSQVFCAYEEHTGPHSSPVMASEVCGRETLGDPLAYVEKKENTAQDTST